jgi:predicted polyphosphate/ATP-dependent NAD kinase
MHRIGFLINPVAGMGGLVGLKGTDGLIGEARRRGAKPISLKRAKKTIELLKPGTGLVFFTSSGDMGETVLREAGIQNYQVLHHYSGESSAEDTRLSTRLFLEKGVDLILFCGGDGTAQDIFHEAGRDVPVLGIPAGVKMYSAVFAVSPETAAEIVKGLKESTIRDSEIMDVDEEAYRAGVLTTRLYGYARTPVLAGRTQMSKHVYEEADEERAKEEIARFIHEVMLPDTLYIMGAGTTTESIALKFGLRKTLLGVDAIKNGKIVAEDADEKTLLDLLEKENDVRIIISPIGAQGFILGRGNQQISSKVVSIVGIGNLIVVATPHKLRDTPLLYVDTGDPGLDLQFGESIQVISGYRIAQRKKIYQPVKT